VYLARWSTLLLAAVLSSPALWQAFVTHELGYTAAGIRFLIAVIVSAVMLAMLRSLTGGFSGGRPGPMSGGGNGTPSKRRRGKDQAAKGDEA
jgi:hypothetical protein